MLKEFLASLAPAPAAEPVVEQPNKFEEYIADQKRQRDSDFQQQMGSLEQIQGERNVEKPLIAERTKTEAAVDIGSGVAQGVWGTVTGGLGAFVDAETLMSLNSVSEGLEGFKSDQVRNDVADYQFRTAQYNKTVEKAIMNGEISDFEGEKLIAWNALKSMSPGQIESIGTSAAGSVGVLIAAAATGNPAAVAAAWTAMSASTVAEPADMILRELYAKNATGDFNITHDDLLASSEIYIKAFGETGDETKARNALYRYAVNDAVWDETNLVGSTIEMLGEYATLRLAKIVKPMQKGTGASRFRPITGMAAEATTEVTGQVGSTISANKAIAETGINPEKRKYSGVGEAVVEAAIGGVAGSGTASASKPVMIAGSVVGSVIGSRFNKGETEADGAAETAQAAQQADESLNNLRQAAAPAQGAEPTQQQAAVNNVITKIDSGFAWTPYTEEDGFSESIRSVTGEATSTVDAMNRLTERVLSGELTPEEVAEYGTAIQSIFAESSATINQMAPAIDALGENSQEYQHAMSWVQNVNKVVQNPQLNKALAAAKEAVAKNSAVIDTNIPVSEQAAATKALKQKIALNPDSLTEEEITNAKMVMEDLIDTGVLSETDRVNIDILSGQIEAAKKLNKKPDGSVANQILFDEVDGKKGPSVATYATEVVSDITHGNHEGAAEKLATFFRFIQSQTNKKEALERSRDNGNQEETYKTTSPTHTNPVDKKISFFKTGGQNLLDDVNTELGFMRDVYEQLRTIVPFETKALPPLAQPKKATTVEEAARVPEPEVNTPEEAGVISQGFKDQVKERVDRRVQSFKDKGPAALAEELRGREKQLADATVGTRNYYSVRQLVDALQDAITESQETTPPTEAGEGVPNKRDKPFTEEEREKRRRYIAKLTEAQLEERINKLMANTNRTQREEDTLNLMLESYLQGARDATVSEPEAPTTRPEAVQEEVPTEVSTTEQPPVVNTLTNDELAADPYADIDTGEEAAPRVDIPEPKAKKVSPVQGLTDLLKSMTTAEYALLAQQVADVLDYPKRLLSNIWSGRVGPKTLEDAPLEQIEQMAQEIIDNRDKPTPPEPTKTESKETKEATDSAKSESVGSTKPNIIQRADNVLNSIKNKIHHGSGDTTLKSLVAMYKKGLFEYKVGDTLKQVPFDERIITTALDIYESNLAAWESAIKAGLDTNSYTISKEHQTILDSAPHTETVEQLFTRVAEVYEAQDNKVTQIDPQSIGDGKPFNSGKLPLARLGAKKGTPFLNHDICHACSANTVKQLREVGISAANPTIGQLDVSGHTDRMGDHKVALVKVNGTTYIVDQPQAEMFTPLSPTVANKMMPQVGEFSPRFIEVTPENLVELYGYTPNSPQLSKTVSRLKGINSFDAAIPGNIDEVINSIRKSIGEEVTSTESTTESVVQGEVQTPTPETKPTETKPEATARATESLKNKVWGKAVKYKEGVTKFWDSETPVADMIKAFNSKKSTSGLGKSLRRMAGKVNQAIDGIQEAVNKKPLVYGLKYDPTKPLQKGDYQIVVEGLKPYLTEDEIASITNFEGKAQESVEAAKNLLEISGQTPEQASKIVDDIRTRINETRPAFRMASLMEDGQFTGDILGAVSLALTDFFVGFGPIHGQLPKDNKDLIDFHKSFGFEEADIAVPDVIAIQDRPERGAKKYDGYINTMTARGFMTHADARSRITDLAMQILGVTPDSKAYEAEIYHPLENLVGTLLDRIIEPEDARKIYVVDAHNNTTLAYLAPEVERDSSYDTTGLLGTITNELLLNKEQRRYINKKVPPIEVSKNGMQLSKAQKEAQDYENSIPFKVNQNMQTIMSSVLGEDGIVEAFGHEITADMNRFDQASKEGKNIQLRNAVAELQSLETDIFESGSNNRDAEIYYNSNVTSVNRSMMEGGQNPKASKVVRAAISPNATVVDMSGVLGSIKEGTFDAFSDIGQFTALAYAQAFGVSIHNLTHQQSLEKLQKILAHPQFEDIATQWFNLSQTGDRADSALIQRSKELLGNDWSEIALQTLVEYGALLNTDNPSEFTTYAYIEADGITNGPFMAAMIAGIDVGNPQWRQFAANGGLYIGQDISSNDYRSQKSEEGALPDNYNMVARAAKRTAVEQRQGALALASEKGVAGQFQNHDAMADEFIVTVFGMKRDDDGEIVISRSAAKNPVTVTFYGSGLKGIGSKFAGEAVDAINKLSTVMLQNQENGVLDVAATAIAFFADGPMANLTTDAKVESLINLFEIIPALTSSEKIYGVSAKTGKSYAFISSKVPNSEAYTKPYTLVRKVGGRYIVDPEALSNRSVTAAQRQKITANMTEYIAKPLQAALQESADSTLDAAKIIQNVTDLFSKLAQARFNEILDAARLEDDFDARNGFSPRQIKNITKQLDEVGIEYEIAGKMFSLVKREGEAKGAAFEGRNNGASTLDQRGEDGTHISQASRLSNVGELGVAGIPRFVQAFGDAATINNFILAAKKAGMKKFMQVYDGINLSADNYIQGSELANEAVMKSIQDRPLNGLLAQMEKGIVNMTNTLSDKYLKNEKNIDYKAEALEALETLKSLTVKVNTNLDVLNEYEYSIDQMAAVGKNALHKGKQIDPEELASEMAVANKALEMSGKTKLMPVKVATDAQIRDAIKNARKTMPDSMKNLVNAIYKQFTESGATLQIEEGGDSSYSINSNTAFVGSNGKTVSARTVIHEMGHATVSKKIQAIASGERVIAKPTLQAYESLKSAFNEASVASNRHTNKIWGRAIDHALNTQARFLGAGLSEAQAEAAMLDEFLISFLTTPELVEQSQTFELSNPFVKLANAAWKIIKDMLGLNHVPDNTLYSALVQSWAEITTSDVSVMTQARMDMLDFGSTPSERAAREAVEQIALGLSPIEKVAAKADVLKSVDEATDVFDTAGFLNTPEQKESFRAGAFVIQAAGQTDKKEVQGLYSMARHIVKNLKPEHFGDTTIPDSPSYYMAQNKYDSVMGMFSGSYSSLVPNLMGLVYASQEMKDIVNQIGMPKGEKGFDRDSKTEERLGTLGYTAIHKLANKLDGIGGSVPADVIQTLVEGLGKKPEGGAVNELTALPSIAYDKANEIVSDTLGRIGGGLEKAGDFVASETKTGKAIGLGLKALGGILNEDSAEAAAEGITTVLNSIDGGKPWKDMLHDMIGRQQSNAITYDLIKQVRSTVQRMRQMYVESTPTNIKKRFTNEPTAEQWSELTKTMAKTDIAAIAQEHGVENTLNMLLDKKAVKDRIKQLEQSILNDQGDGQARLQKAKQLAGYMVTGKTGSNLLTNANDIAYLYGEEGQTKTVSKGLTNKIDEYVSLVAFSGSNNSTFELLTKTEREGIHFTLATMVGNRKEEQRKAQTAGVWGFKGHIQMPHDGHLAIVRDSDAEQYLKKGYVRVGDYVNSSSDPDRTKKGYYISNLSASRPFAQGIIQNAVVSVNGVVAETGESMNTSTAPMDLRHLDLDRMSGKLQGDTATYGLIPRYDHEGNLIGAVRSIDPSVMEALNQNTSLPELLGIQRGRQVEESVANNFNTVIADELNREYERSNKKGEFVNLLDPELAKSDKVVGDALSIMNREFLRYGKSQHGRIMVKKEMLNNVVGYRQLGIASIFDGTTNMDERTRKAIVRALEQYIGPKAYHYLVRGEEIWRGIVGDAKQLIVVKSVIVPAINALSNIVHLMGRGVPIADIVTGIPRKLAEIEKYSSAQKRLIEIEGEMLAAEGKPSEITKLRAEKVLLEEANARLSIAPLLRAGEFASIVSAKIDQESSNLAKGKIAEYMEGQINRLDGGMKTTAKNLLMTKDTAMYQFLQKSVDYGDFIAKSIIYDDIISRQGRSPEYALGKVREEFINYDYLPGRFRGFLEGNGLLWFYNFKMRSMKIAISMIRENPLHTVVSTAAVPMSTPFGNLGIPTDDNILYKLVDGTAQYSVGPEMGIRSWQLHPLYQLLK